MNPREPRCQDELEAAPIAKPGAASGEGSALIARVQDWAYRNQIPLNASIEVTLRCNIRCLHCYNFDRDEPREACGAPELTTDELRRVMSELREAGCLFLMLTGGEILSRPDLFELLDHARSLNFAVQLLTNGTMLRPGVAARLATYQNLQGVSVSLYGATAEVHDAVTQMPGSHRRTWDGINRLRHLGVAVRLKFVLMKQNAHEAGEMRAQADARGFAYLVDVTVTPRHDGTQGSLATRLDRDALEGLYRGPLRDLVRRERAEHTEESFPCNCARGNVAITATGNVQPCISVPWSAGNVREQPFAEIWRRSPVFAQIRGYKMADYEACTPCAHRRHCTRDRGAALMSSGRYTGTDPYVCMAAEVTHTLDDERRAQAAGEAASVRARLAVLR